MTMVFETTDVEAASQAFSGIYHIRRFTAPGEHPYVRIEQDTLGPVDLHHLTFTMECDVEGGPLGALYLGHVVGGNVTYHYAQDSAAYAAGDVFLAAQPDVTYRADIGSADLEYAALDVRLLAQVASTGPAGKPQPVRFTGDQPTARDATLWLSTCRYVRDTFVGAPADQPALVINAAARLLAATALAVFPNNSLTDPTGADRHDAHPATLRRAISFIEDNARNDISPADIAAAAHVTIRALQLAFRRHLDTTPTGYLRRVRLEHAHDELVSADPRRETVTAVAYRWGFGSHSRFTAHYRHAYGVLPTDTLRG